jgi:hypothetical protein
VTRKRQADKPKPLAPANPSLPIYNPRARAREQGGLLSDFEWPDETVVELDDTTTLREALERDGESG